LQDEHRTIRESLLRREIEAAEARAETEIARTKADMVEELERKNQELEAFSYSVSHDLRTPLRAIDGFSTMLIDGLSGQLDESGEHYAERIRSGVARMTEMIDDLLELSRIGRAQLQRSRVDLAEMAGTVLADLAATHPERQVRVVIGTAMTASADPRLIRNVLENLIGNAWKFTARAEQPRIEIGVLRDNGHEVFFVRDNGAGFSMDYAGKLFTPFQRLHSPSEYAGTGIGLATVQRIMLRHGGRVWADAKVGKGAAFFFTLGGDGAGNTPQPADESASSNPTTGQSP
jgi:light-regulated signal transduction histidine kinase (bacteriophytochrome)